MTPESEFEDDVGGDVHEEEYDEDENKEGDELGGVDVEGDVALRTLMIVVVDSFSTIPNLISST